MSLVFYLLLGAPDRKMKTSRSTAPNLVPFDGDLARIALIHGPSFSFISSAGSCFLSTSSQSSGLWRTHTYFLGKREWKWDGEKKTTEVETVVRSLFHNVSVVHKWNPF